MQVCWVTVSSGLLDLDKIWIRSVSVVPRFDRYLCRVAGSVRQTVCATLRCRLTLLLGLTRPKAPIVPHRCHALLTHPAVAWTSHQCQRSISSL
jgi:hypothetical protein